MKGIQSPREKGQKWVACGVVPEGWMCETVSEWGDSMSIPGVGGSDSEMDDGFEQWACELSEWASWEGQGIENKGR